MTRTIPPSPIASSDVPWKSYGEGTRFGGRYRHLTLAALGKAHYHVGVSLEELDPGKQSNPAHYHSMEEEHVFILEGTLTVRVGAETHEMKAGDYVCFPAGQKAGHCLVNNGQSTCRYVIAGERKRDDVCVYTDSAKVLVRSLGRRAILDLGASRDYWHGEDTGAGPLALPPAPAIEIADSVPPKRPVSSDAVAWNPEGDGTRFGGRSKHLTFAAVGGEYHVGVLIEQPAPGKRLCPTHYHMLEEEHALILDGEITLILGDQRIPLKPGDYVCFPAGQKIGHSFMNTGAGPSSYLMIGERNPNEVCVYPDSNKVMVRALRSEDSIFDMRARRRYYDGET